MNPGQVIEIQLVDMEGAPVRLGNVLPEVRLFYRGKRARPLYTFEIWATDENGRCQIRFEDLEAKRKLLASSDLMDFNVPLTECDPEIEINIAPESDYLQRRDMPWRQSWWRPTWLLEWPANGRLAPVEPKRATLRGPVTHVAVAVDVLPSVDK